MKKKKKGSEVDRYQDFLDDLSQFSAGEEEEYLVARAGYAPSGKEIIVKVGESVKAIRKKKSDSAVDPAEMSVHIIR